MAKTISMGTDYKIDDDMSLTLEAFYGMKDDAKDSGFNGLPVWFMFGKDIKMGKSTINASGTFAKNHAFHMNATHKLDSNWTVALHQHLYTARIGGKGDAVETGFELSYKL